MCILYVVVQKKSSLTRERQLKSPAIKSAHPFFAADLTFDR